MTNKELIDHCNRFWHFKGHCVDCPYGNTYCASFFGRFGDTPYHEDHFHDGKYYTDEEIEE